MKLEVIFNGLCSLEGNQAKAVLWRLNTEGVELKGKITIRAREPWRRGLSDTQRIPEQVGPHVIPVTKHLILNVRSQNALFIFLYYKFIFLLDYVYSNL